MLSSFLFGFSTGALLLPTFLRDSFYLVLLFISFFSLSLRGGGGRGRRGRDLLNYWLDQFFKRFLFFESNRTSPCNVMLLINCHNESWSIDWLLYLACPENKWGPNCRNSCPCLNKAKCDPVSGECSCSSGWQGQHCDRPCPKGTFGQSCLQKCKVSSLFIYLFLSLSLSFSFLHLDNQWRSLPPEGRKDQVGWSGGGSIETEGGRGRLKPSSNT